MKLKEFFLWDIERSGPLYFLFIGVLAILLAFIHDGAPAAPRGVVVKQLSADLYFVGFDPSADLSGVERTPDILIRTAADLRGRTSLNTLTPLYNGRFLSAILVSRGEETPGTPKPQ